MQYSTDLRSLSVELSLCVDMLGEEVGVFIAGFLRLLQVFLGLGQNVCGLVQVACSDGQLAGCLFQLLFGVREQLWELMIEQMLCDRRLVSVNSSDIWLLKRPDNWLLKRSFFAWLEKFPWPEIGVCEQFWELTI